MQSEKTELEQQIKDLKELLTGERSIRSALIEDIALCRAEKVQSQQKLSSVFREQLFNIM